jgi:hypothetical protein
MINENALVSTAVLTAIWEENQQDNIDLITPFIKYIISRTYKVNDTIDQNAIINRMKSDFCFNNFPHAILEIILKRMTRKQFLTKNNNKFIVLKDFTQDNWQFENRLIKAKEETKNVINNLQRHMFSAYNQKFSLEETEILFSIFLDSFGYNTYENIGNTKLINPKKDVNNYRIGEFINIEYSKNSEVFGNIMKIIEGYMIANAIYLQIENDNKASLKKLNCFLDTTFLLRLLGFKTPVENDSAKELYNLLRKYNANLMLHS